MKNIESRKVEFLREGLYSKIVSPIIGTLVSVAIGLYGANFVMTNSLLGKSFSKEKIEQRAQEQESVLVNKLLTGLFIQNPVAQEGRNLAYFFYNFGEPEKLIDNLFDYAQGLMKKKRINL